MSYYPNITKDWTNDTNHITTKGGIGSGLGGPGQDGSLWGTKC